jgi:transposase
MITDGKVMELRRMLAQGKSLAASSRMTDMNDKTARKYRDDDRLPSQRKLPREYRTRIDPFAEVWDEVQARLEAEPRLKASTLFEWLQRAYPSDFPDSTRRTFERRVSLWRSLQGPGKTVFFSQLHHAGRLAASDFTVCNDLGVKIAGVRFDHTLFHCVLSYSNVESVSLCFSESFEALSEGIQKAFWEFGGAPQRHRSDSLSAAVRNHSTRKLLTDRYAALMNHYRCEPERTNARCANENGDVESSNGHVKDRIDQALMLRGSRDFASRQEYMQFVEEIVARANAHRQQRFAEEQACLQQLPAHRLGTDDILPSIRVSKSSTIQVRTNTYSVPSRLIGKKVDVRLGAEQIVVTYQEHHIQTMPRLFGKQGVSINYRHVIDSLMRKPGAFANYRYREEMFPTTQFRMAYDMLRAAHAENVGDKKYVQILELAARESQDAVAEALRWLITNGQPIDVDQVREMVQRATSLPAVTDLEVEPPNLTDFDSLLHTFDKESLYDETDQKETSQHNAHHQAGDEPRDGGPDEPVDQSVPRIAAAELSRSLPAIGDSCHDGEPQPPGVSGRTDDARMPGATTGPHPTLDEKFQTPLGEDLGLVPIRPSTAECQATTGNAARRIVPGSSRERSDFWAAGFGEEPCPLRLGRTTDLPWTQPAVHDLQLVGSAVADCQAGLAITEADQTVIELRGPDHRRPGLRAAEPRGNGSAVHAAGGTLRAWQCVVDEQLGVQQVGPDLQGRDDDCGRDRPLGTSQRDHRVECAQLPSGNRQEHESVWTITGNQGCQIEYLMGNSNCR